jgi:hypothetical protein
VTQVVVCLPSKPEAMSLNPSTAKKKKNPPFIEPILHAGHMVSPRKVENQGPRFQET